MAMTINPRPEYSLCLGFTFPVSSNSLKMLHALPTETFKLLAIYQKLCSIPIQHQIIHQRRSAEYGARQHGSAEDILLKVVSTKFGRRNC